MPIATKRKILIATLIALALVAGLLVWYFSALTHYRLSLNKRYSYHLTYHSKTIADFPPLIDRDFGNVLPIPMLDLNLVSLNQIMNAAK